MTDNLEKSQWIFFPVMPNKSTTLIKLLNKMIVYIINKIRICKLCRCMRAFEK